MRDAANDRFPPSMSLASRVADIRTSSRRGLGEAVRRISQGRLQLVGDIGAESKGRTRVALAVDTGQYESVRSSVYE